MDFPVRFYAPMVLDWSGAKFSKSLYVQSDAYHYLPKGLTNYQKFLETYGEAGLRKIWKEVQSRVSDPKKLFRDYFQLLLDSASFGTEG